MNLTLTLLTGLILASFTTLHAADAATQLTPTHRAAVEHQRRIFSQYDPAADILREGGFGSDIDRLMGYVFGYVDQPGSQLDAICIDVSNEGVAHYRSKILPEIQHPGLVKWRGEGIDYFSRMIEEGHRRGKEIWWGLRMNEVERGHLNGLDGGSTEMKMRNPVKAAHPEWLIQSWWWQGFWNYAVKEVRDYRLSIIKEVIDQYDFDGVHLDFLRHTPHLPPGQQWENRQHLTTFLVDLRRMLQTRAAERGRPIMLAVRIPDSVKGCQIDGFDVEAWAKQGLVDLFVIGTRTIQIDLASFRQVTSGTRVKLIPSFDSFHSADGYQANPSVEFLRGVFANYWHQGADSVGIFNSPASTPEHGSRVGLRPSHHPSQAETISSIGSLETLAGRERVYAIDRRGGYPHGEGYFSSNMGAQLPVKLRNNRAVANLTLPVWEIVKSDAEGRLRLILDQCVDTDEVVVSLNSTPMKRVLVDSAWKDPRLFLPAPQPATMTAGAINKDLAKQRLTRVEFSVPGGALKRGANEVAVSAVRTGPFPAGSYVTIEKVELDLK